jgi:hypothetical protein
VTTTIKIFHARDFIRASAEGKFDFDASMKAFREIASTAAGLADCEILFDTRLAQSEMSVADLWYLASELYKLGYRSNGKTALLCPLERFDSVGFFALCAKNRGFKISAFASFEDAIEWLIADEN